MIGLSKAEQLKKNGRIKKPVYKNKEYLEWIHTKPCIVCGTLPVHAHHVSQGIGNRADDTCVPLCQEHHQGKWSTHGFDSAMFYGVYPKEELLRIAKELHREWKNEI